MGQPSGNLAGTNSASTTPFGTPQKGLITLGRPQVPSSIANSPYNLSTPYGAATASNPVNGQQNVTLNPYAQYQKNQQTSQTSAPDGSYGSTQTPPKGTGAAIGQKAPDGYEYDSTGKLVPLGTSTQVGTSFPSVVSSLSGLAGQSSPQFQAALNQYNQANEQLQQLKTAAANNQFIGAGTNMAEYAGTQGLIANRLANEENALTGEMTAAQQAAQVATGQQGTQQQGLNAAGSLVSPQLGQIGQVPFYPGTGNQGNILGASGGNSALNPLNNIQSIARQVISGQISPAQAYAMGGSVQNFQGALNAEIQKESPGFNTATAQGKYDANQSNTQTSGVTPTNAAASVYAQSYQQLLDLKNTTANVDQFGNLLLNSMKDNNGNLINPSNLKYANQTLSQIRNQLSSEQQAVFDNTFASLKSRVSGLLAMGGSEIPSQITSDANKILDGSLPFSSLSAVLQRITTEGNILTTNLQNKLNTSGSIIGAPTSGGNTNPLGI